MFLRRLVSVVLVVLLMSISIGDVFAKGTTRASSPSRVSSPKVPAPKVSAPKVTAPKTKTDPNKSTKVDLTKKDTTNTTTSKVTSKPVTSKITTAPQSSGYSYSGHPVYYTAGSYMYFATINGNDCDYDDYLEGDSDCQAYYADEDDVKQPTPKQDKHSHGWFIFWIIFFMLTTALFTFLYIFKCMDYNDLKKWKKHSYL